MTKRFSFLALFLFAVSSAAATTKPLRIVTSIKPVHALVAGITQGVLEPELLMSSNQSPHHYSLRPSERRMLAEADLVFWIGPNMESFMPRLLESLANKDKAVSLIQSQGLKLLPLRSAGDGHGREEHNHEEHGMSHEYSKIDAHIWLNTHNVDILVDAITQQMIRIDPEHKQQYQTNNQHLHQQIAQLRNTLQQSLSTIKTSFLTYHDAYHYFEDEFGLNNAGFITTSELQPGARRISELKKTIKQQNITCIFYNAPTEPPVLKLFLAENNVNTFMLDPVGVQMPLDNNAWFEIMHSLAKQFIKCQQGL